MNTEEPQNVSTVIEQVRGKHSKVTEGQDQETNSCNADHDSADSEEDNLVLFDTTHSQNNQPDILKTISISDLQQEIEKLTTERNQLAKELEETQMTNKEKLEAKCFKQQEQIESLQEKLAQEQEKFQSKLTKVQNELNGKFDQASKLYQETCKEKDRIMGKLAVLEKNKRTLIEDNDMLNMKYKEALKDNEKSKAQYKVVKADTTKLNGTIEKLESSLREKTEEVTKFRGEVNSLNVKLKWAQNKLKSESEAHKEAQSKLATTLQKLQESREEGEQIRNDMKAMIVAYQDSEEKKSSTLDVKLKETERELKQHEKEIADQMELYEVNKRELDATKSMLEEYLQENRVLKDKVSVMEKSLHEQDRTSEQVRCENNRLKEQIEKLNDKISGFQPTQDKLQRSEAKCLQLEESAKKQQLICADLQNDLASCLEKERELLEFSEKLTSLNAELQATKDNLSIQVAEKTLENEQLSEEITSLNKSNTSLSQQLSQTAQESEELKQALIDKSKAVEQLSIALGEKENEVIVAKKKQAGSLKDLQKQLTECKRYIEQQQQLWANHCNALSSQNNDGEDQRWSKGGGKSPQKSPTGSLDQLPMTAPDLLKTMDRVPSPVQSMGPDKALLVDKLVKSRKDIAKRDEKVEFLEEHIRQLTEELQKKSKIIKSYLIREESGILTTPRMDEDKVSRSRKGGIMASVFRSRAHSGDMSLELSLEINQKLQAVLEDTILKNITLKDNIKTLGNQIAILTQRMQR
ncbi:coiled-coil domain-containing protein 186-like isoform X2 [Dysidea avara]|uniref:coiled-coil domain-containing protein 186-like isoform X2 n=1 Tax=Dysidea avara TaxID=196820 RepID=UPI003329341F